MARDKRNLYFYVSCAETITSPRGASWMRLLIDCDRNKSTGWEGYDFIVNRIAPGKKAVIERNTGGWSWETVGEISFRVNGNRIEMAVPKKLLGIDSAVDLEFKWADNMQRDGDMNEFYLNGDAAPQGRFNYLYRAR